MRGARTSTIRLHRPEAACRPGTLSRRASGRGFGVAVAVVSFALMLTLVAEASARKPLGMGDLFLVDQDGGWLCPPAGARDNTQSGESPNVKCPAPLLGTGQPRDSRAAVEQLVYDLEAQRKLIAPPYLRVAKARNDCRRTECSTAVPKAQECGPALSPDNPFCALKALRHRKVKLGVIIGAAKDPAPGINPGPRSVKQIARHACMVNRADTANLYGFMFLDLAFKLSGRKLRSVVSKIQQGRTPRARRGWKHCRTPGTKKTLRWPRLITNDTLYPKGPTLDTGAWAHAKHLGLLDGNTWKQRAKRAAKGKISALTPEDRRFVRAVHRVDPDSHAILRFEVPQQTSKFAQLDPATRQCPLLSKWARGQRGLGYTFLHPLYVHAINQSPKDKPYDSFAEGTLPSQLNLIDRFASGPPKPKPTGCGSSGGSDAPATGRTPPGPRAPTVESQEPSAITCNSARLNGFVSPHASPSRFRFEYWKRGEKVRQDAGGGDAGSGKDRRHVSRVATGLRRHTAYSARLLASNAGGQSASGIFSFTTARKHC